MSQRAKIRIYVNLDVAVNPKRHFPLLVFTAKEFLIGFVFCSN